MSLTLKMSFSNEVWPGGLQKLQKNHSPLKNCDVLQVAEKDWMDLYNVGTIKQIHRAALKFDITYNPFLNSVYCSLFNNISNYIKT